MPNIENQENKNEFSTYSLSIEILMSLVCTGFFSLERLRARQRQIKRKQRLTNLFSPDNNTLLGSYTTEVGGKLICSLMFQCIFSVC